MIVPSGQRDEVNEKGYASLVVSVSTTQVEAKCGANRLTGRQEIIVYNDSTNIIFFGPNGVTATGSTKGIPIEQGCSVSITIGDVALYLITASGTSSVIVQEFA